MISTKNRTLGKQLATTNSTIYIVPNNWESTVSSILITNITSSSQTVSLDWYEAASGTYYPITKLTVVPANGIVQITDAFYLSQADYIRGLSGTAASITVSILVEEAFSPAQF